MDSSIRSVKPSASATRDLVNECDRTRKLVVRIGDGWICVIVCCGGFCIRRVELPSVRAARCYVTTKYLCAVFLVYSECVHMWYVETNSRKLLAQRCQIFTRGHKTAKSDC